MNLLLITLGGGIGALLRYLSSKMMHSCFQIVFPIGTIFVNCLGSLIIGLLFGIFEKYTVPTGLKLFLITGFLGGYTTFSAYSIETAAFLINGEIKAALLNIVISNVLCLVFALTGIYLSRFLVK